MPIETTKKYRRDLIFQTRKQEQSFIKARSKMNWPLYYSNRFEINIDSNSIFDSMVEYPLFYNTGIQIWIQSGVQCKKQYCKKIF